MLIAIVDNKWMDVTGTAAEPAGQVLIVHDEDTLTVTDNDTVGTTVTVTGGAPEDVLHIDASGVTGAGVEVQSDVDHDTKITTTEADDLIRLSGAGNDTVKAYEGDDVVFGGAGDDFLDGHIGNDALSGGDGDDILRGHSGDDLIDGGEGDDTATFRGNSYEYYIHYVDGRLTVTHVSGTGADGTDIIANVEWLEFADQTIAVSSIPQNITVALDGKYLDITGTAFDNDGYVTIVQDENGVIVTDNDVLETGMDEPADTSGVKHIDASGLDGAGVKIVSDFDGTSKLIGTSEGDHITANGTGDDKLKGYEGDDFLFGGEGNDFLDGHVGNDSLYGGTGNDELRGHGGDDWVDGGAGEDTIVFKGAYAEYVASESGGVYSISHVGGKANDGTDDFVNIEWLEFADQVVAIDDLILV